MRVYRLISSEQHMGTMEEDFRLMTILHNSRQPSHIIYETTRAGFVEQHLVTDMSLPFLGESVMAEDITPDPPPE